VSPFLSLRCGPALSDPPSPHPPWTGACALAHVPGFLGHDARAPSSLFRAPPVPRAHPSPHFAQLCPLSRSALAASRRRRPAPMFPAIQLTGDRAKPPRAPPEVRHPSPCAISFIAPCVRLISPSPVLDRGDPPCSRGVRPIWPGLVHRSRSLCHPVSAEASPSLSAP
jgi:hypothetical protein